MAKKAAWPKTAVKAAMREYQRGLGTQHPERMITIDAFEQRIKEFELVVGEWMDDERRLQLNTIARRWGKSLGMKSWDAVPCFNRMWEIVDRRFPIS